MSDQTHKRGGTKGVLIFFLALLCLFVGSGVLWFAAKRTASSNVGSVAEVDESYEAPERELTEFTFTDQVGRPFGSKDLAGKVWMGSFFFADCPGICVSQNQEIAKLHERFRDQGVVIVNITVTPDKDPAHKLLKYARRFDADNDSWRFLTTDRDIEYVRQVGAEFFGLPAADATHTSDVAVFDRSGKMHSTYNVNKPAEFAKLVLKVEDLLKSDSSAAVEDVTQQSEPSDQDS